MPVTNYHAVDGEIQGQSAGGTRTDYLTDALGSVVATVTSSAQVVNTYRYKPYGERLAKTGVGADPRFGWTGDTGSRRTERSPSDQYNQARHYGTQHGGWTSADPIGLVSAPYSYCSQSPVTTTDRTGLRPAQSLFHGVACPDGNCEDYPVPIPRLDPKDCDGSDPAERQSILDGILNAFCQARSFCQGVLPLWCQGKFIPSEEHRVSGD